MNAYVTRCLIGVLGLSALLTGCGGGGGGSDGGGAAGTPVPVPTKLEFPSMLTDSSFSLPALPAPPDRQVPANVQRGQVLSAPGMPVAAGLSVELLDATEPDMPRVLAFAKTMADGLFELQATAAGVAPADLSLRVTLGDGSTLRAWASGWTEISPGTEVAVREVARLRRAGAFATRALTAAELSAAQQSLSLLWLGRPAAVSPTAGVLALQRFVLNHASWNDLLNRMAADTPLKGSGDVAGLIPVGSVTWNTDVVNDGQSSTATFLAGCSVNGEPRNCSITASNQQELTDRFDVHATGVRLLPDGVTSDSLSALLTELGPLPLIEFPYVVGSRVLVDAPRFKLALDGNVRASVKITRRTYPVEAVQALGGRVPAVRVVLDYEIAILNFTTQKQVDVLAREQRWFSPQGGRVRMESTGIARAEGQLTPANLSVVANNVTGDFFASPTLPYAGVARVQALGLRYRHAVYAPRLNRVFVSMAGNAGQLLELDADTLTTLRSVALPAVAGRLAVSIDGSRVYAGLDGGQVIELDTTTLTQQRQFALPADPYGRAYDRIYDLAVDPFDASRVLLLAGQSGVFGNSGAVLLYRSGLLVQRDAPRYSADDYGWGYYSPGALAWTSRPDEFMAVSFSTPSSLYRLRTGLDAASEVASLERVDDVGWLEVGGEILSPQGRVIDSHTLAPLRRLRLADYALKDCQRQTAQNVLCQPKTGFSMTPPYLALLDAATGDFKGAYVPRVGEVSNGCTGLGIREGSLGLDGAYLQPMDGRRSLVFALGTGNRDYCSLQVWTLTGAGG